MYHESFIDLLTRAIDKIEEMEFNLLLWHCTQIWSPLILNTHLILYFREYCYPTMPQQIRANRRSNNSKK